MNSSKDILAAEKDKEKLKRLSDDVQMITYRQGFEKKPDEIYDEIELLLGSMTSLEPDKNSSLKPDDFVDLNDYRIDLTNSNGENHENKNRVEEANPEEPIMVEETPKLPDTLPVIEEEKDDSIIFEPINEEAPVENVQKDVSESDKNKESDNRFKVIRVEPLAIENQNVEKLDSDDQDSEDDYISFNNLLEGDENEGTN